MCECSHMHYYFRDFFVKSAELDGREAIDANRPDSARKANVMVCSHVNNWVLRHLSPNFLLTET